MPLGRYFPDQSFAGAHPGFSPFITTRCRREEQFITQPLHWRKYPSFVLWTGNFTSWLGSMRVGNICFRKRSSLMALIYIFIIGSWVTLRIKEYTNNYNISALSPRNRSAEKLLDLRNYKNYDNLIVLTNQVIIQ